MSPRAWGATAATATPFQPDPATLYAPHFAAGRFFNPWQHWPLRFRDVLRWYRHRPFRRPVEQPAPWVPNDGSSLAFDHPRVELTWIGHSSFALAHRRCVLLTDPHFSARALVPKRQVELGIPLDAVPRGATAVLSHSHYDHLDAWTVRNLPADTDWLVPLGLADRLRKMGARRVRELDWWESAESGSWRLTCLPAQHWSRRLTQPQDTTLWCSWLIDTGGQRIYFAGDSGWFHGFSEIGRRFAPIDIALLPIGAYEPRWFMRYQHMDPGEAVRAFVDLGARTMVGMHWGTFVLTDELLDEPPRAVLAAATAAGVSPERVQTPPVGSAWTPP